MRRPERHVCTLGVKKQCAHAMGACDVLVVRAQCCAWLHAQLWGHMYCLERYSIKVSIHISNKLNVLECDRDVRAAMGSHTHTLKVTPAFISFLSSLPSHCIACMKFSILHWLVKTQVTAAASQVTK